MTETPNYDGFLRGPSEDAMAQLSALADEQARYEKIVADVELQLATAKDALRQVAEVQIPELMERIGMETFTTTSGLKVIIKEDIRASIPKETERGALTWLRDNGHGRLIKRTVKLQFGKGQDQRADALVADLSEKGFDVEDKAGVHFMTLSSFVREMLESGKDIPSDLFSIFKQRRAKLG